MADNTTLNTGTGGDIISTDVITTLNGSVIATGEKAQRVKVGWGVDGTFTDTNVSNPLPISAASLPLPTGAALDATLTGGTQQAKLTDGTNIANILANDTGYNGQVINNATKTLTFTTSSAGAQVLLPNTDIRGYASIKLVYTAVGTGLAGTAQFAPNSGGTFSSTSTWTNRSLSTATPGVSGVSVNVPYESPTSGAYFQLNITALTSGTVSGYVILSAMPTVYHTINVGANTATGSAVPGNAFYIGLNANGTLTGAAALNVVTDGITGTGTLSTGPSLYNGSTWDRQRNNLSSVVVAAGATAGSTTTITTYNAREMVLVVNVSAYTSGTINLAISGVSVSSYTYPLLPAITGLAATGVATYRVGIGMTAAAGLVANDVLPRSVQIVVSGTFVATFGIDVVLGV